MFLKKRKNRIALFLLLILLSGACSKSAQNTALPSPSPAAAKAPASTEAPVVLVEAEVVPDAPAFTPPPEITVPPTATPVPTPTPVPFQIEPVPDSYRAVKGFARTKTSGVLYSESEDLYVAYGSAEDPEKAFYPSDAEGNVEPGAAPTSRIVAVRTYAPFFAPDAEGEWLLAVYLPSQSIVAFREQEGEWVEHRIMICSTGKRNNETPTGRYTIYERYEYKLLGTEDAPCYGLWACRFKTHYLFHSVPISANAGRDVEKGHRMTNMKKFEKLGSVASNGCIRVTVGDAKWIYDLSADRTVSVWITSDPGPEPPKPPAVIWSEPYTNKQGLGWEPTDPHPDNPYLKNASPSPES